ncbi:unnamed protein product [Cuscuta epithymum]|uniref:CRM domain-containing protein n=1 Tax=Cuscuta epithymum TaxID=186058 RepID=A0AAV0GIB1_9ASTE|nr:unnamed protein product [Cuscuta epithymum]CAH9147650.1 unnamed protein product [Cuscuta epithymum]
MAMSGSMSRIRRFFILFPVKPFYPSSPIPWSSSRYSKPIADLSSTSGYRNPFIPLNIWWGQRNFSHGTVNFVISSDGKPRFETLETDPPKKEKWVTKKRLKEKRKREKKKRKAANKRDPRRLGVKGKKKKQKFATAEERIKNKIENAKVKEAMLVERLKRYEVSKVQGPEVMPHNLTGEERFYIKRMAQKKSNYVPIGRRGVFGGVILNMHLHWKKHETVKVYCKPCKPGQIKEYADEIARLSGGIPIQIIGDDTIVFYRGKDYVQPEVMSPIDTLSKKKALEKSKYEQSLESVRRFIAIAEKELELYYRHVALYGDPSDRNPHSILNSSTRKEGGEKLKEIKEDSLMAKEDFYESEVEADCSGRELSEYEDGSETETDNSNQELSDYDDCSDEDQLASEAESVGEERIYKGDAKFTGRTVRSCL